MKRDEAYLEIIGGVWLTVSSIVTTVGIVIIVITNLLVHMVR